MRDAGAEAPTVGLISDTHGLLRTEAIHALEGCQIILHAGDVGRAEILESLAQIAPVTAVKGNIDTGDWAVRLPLTAAAELGDTRFYMVHDVHDLDLNPAVAGFKVVVSGHSHRPGLHTKGGVTYINPGSAGPRRFQLPVTIARIKLNQPVWEIRFVDLISGRPLEV